ncbi:hypothetical protein [uncultured Fibrobacter sp.]|jgi:hypothetical protein|uniref:hypothetical protein n=1 Tax=uncultured Fibrobacter sp. TaxID=261512 RepID=UPI002605B928|nr:hypothetical protein [uncultured Fibrobacter sp.]
MFDDEDHKRAIKDFIAYLRTITTQKNLAFFSDVSREYVRSLGKGEGIPSVKVFFGLIEAAGLNIIEGTQKYLEILQSQHLAQVAEKGVALNYIHKTKRAKSL